MNSKSILPSFIKNLSSTLLITLIAGCGNSQESARKELVKLGKDFTMDSFIECVGDNDKQAVTLFVQAGFDVNTPAENGITALHIAAMQGNTEIVKILLDKGANPNVAVAAGTEKGSTPLMMAAAMGGHLEALKLLLDKGAKVNAEDDNGWTALDYAAAQTNLDIVKVLRQHGAPAVTDVGLTKFLKQFQRDLRAKAFQSMEAGESADACRKLIAEQLVNFQQEQSFTADQLLQAKVCAFNTIWDAVDKFVLTRPSPVVTDQDRQAVQPFVELRKELQTNAAVQRDLLLVAAGKGEAGKVKWLLDNGADVNVKNESGFTPLTFAISSEGPRSDVIKTVEMLLDAGADCNSKQGPYGMTPTMDAVILPNNNTDILKLILAKKPDVNAVNSAGQTALQAAKAANHTEAAVLLENAGAKE